MSELRLSRFLHFVVLISGCVAKQYSIVAKMWVKIADEPVHAAIYDFK